MTTDAQEDVKAQAKPKRGLGRGLDALFSDGENDLSPADNAAASSSGSAFAPSGSAIPVAGRQMLAIDQMYPGALQPRTVFDNESLDELAASIKEHGVLQPILVRPDNKDDRGGYEIIAGERRWRAAQRAGLHDVPVIIQDFTDEEALQIGLIENLQRKDLNPVDEATGYKKLIDVYGHTQDEVADSVGKSRPYVANMVRLLSLPIEVLAFLEMGQISIGHARALITAKNPASFLNKITQYKLSVRQTEKLVNAEAKGRVTAKGKIRKPEKDVDTVALENDLSNHLGMRVSIESSSGEKGKVTVEFKTLDQLDEVLKRLSGV